MIKIVFVVAVADNGVIGRNNALPWRLKEDLRRFRAATMGRPVLMGRKTYESIGRPLPGRTNIVITRQAGYAAPGVAAAGLEQALDLARGDALRRGVLEMSVIGGRDIFEALMSAADRIELTRVHASPTGDVFFPELEPDDWVEERNGTHPADAENSAPTTFVTLLRRR